MPGATPRPICAARAHSDLIVAPMLPLESPRWHSLAQAYGTAEDVKRSQGRMDMEDVLLLAAVPGTLLMNRVRARVQRRPRDEEPTADR